LEPLLYLVICICMADQCVTLSKSYVLYIYVS
jgi:hypothetical protein